MYGHIKEDGITVSSDEDDHANILSSTKAMAKYLQTLKRVQRDRCRPRVGFAQQLHALGEKIESEGGALAYLEKAVSMTSKVGRVMDEPQPSLEVLLRAGPRR